MNCRRVNSLLSAYIDGELAGVEHLQVQRHLQECAACAEEHETLLNTKRMLSNMRCAAPREDLEARILARVAQERAAPRPFARALAWWAVETPAWRFRLSLATVGAAVAIAFLAAAVRPMDDERIPSHSVATAHITPLSAEPVVPVGDIRMLHESWQGPLGAGAQGIPASTQATGQPGPSIVPVSDRADITDIGPR